MYPYISYFFQRWIKPLFKMEKQKNPPPPQKKNLSKKSHQQPESYICVSIELAYVKASADNFSKNLHSCLESIAKEINWQQTIL